MQARARIRTYMFKRVGPFSQRRYGCIPSLSIRTFRDEQNMKGVKNAQRAEPGGSTRTSS